MLVTRLAIPVLTFAISLGQSDGKEVTRQIVDLGYAKYEGVPSAFGNTNFLGVRYAAPPTGNLRFREPYPPSKTSGIQVADTHPYRCRNGDQNTTSTLNKRDFNPPPNDEDCLFLNLVVPGTEIKPSAKLPVVLVGVDTTPGQGGEDVIFDGNDLVQLSGGKAIAILIQYRLGVYGFLAGEDVKKGGALNAGLLDQQFAFKWIQKHISKFGGDPRRVTLWGESAGAGSVLQQLIANGGQTSPPLFDSAILSSIYYPPQYKYNDPVPEKVYNDVVRIAGCDGRQNKLDCLRGADVLLLDKAGRDITFGGFYFTTYIQPRNVLIVANTNEGSIFVDPAYSSDLTSYISALLPTISPRDAKLGAELYEGLGSVLDQAIKFNGEFIFICPTYALLRSLNGHGYKGHFAVPPAAHYQDAPYYFPSSSASGAPLFNNTAFINTFGGSFLDFAVHGTPNVNRTGSLLPYWPKWREPGQKEATFNRTESLEPDVHISETPSDLLERCRFWDSIGQSVGH
ncbi:alpha beta-hydrolase [Coprinellus micaceus]|uniref:Carboxylic ester hydrolase n=1 Tax=Coprinellus micaceus TaxID=71717 RepID=A0A4Y7SSC2_COPMI|nr:alpha beta-hydrolase [Coprinellus micaceus]